MKIKTNIGSNVKIKYHISSRFQKQDVRDNVIPISKLEWIKIYLNDVLESVVHTFYSVIFNKTFLLNIVYILIWYSYFATLNSHVEHEVNKSVSELTELCK